MSEIPLEVAMNAERLYDDGGYESVPTIIAKAIMAERDRCLTIIQSIETTSAQGMRVIDEIVRKVRGDE